MNGAVQGEAMATASTPDKNASATGWRSCTAGQSGGQQVADVQPARQVHGQQGKQHGQAGDDSRRLQLEAPAQLLATRPQRQQQSAQRHKGKHHTGGVRQALRPLRRRGDWLP